MPGGRFTVKDNGIGMSEEYLPHLFDAFTQEDSSYSNKYGSTGLGMPITKNMVELMNGHIEVESKKNVGTTFVITVTLSESERSKVEKENGELTPNEMSVLVIDDDPIACEHAVVVLGQVAEDMPVMDGLEATKAIRALERPDAKTIPIIALTANAFDEDVQRSLQAGLNAHLSKPIEPDTLFEILENLI